MDNQKKQEMGLYTNRPHLNTHPISTNAVIDWLEVTFKQEQNLEKIFSIFRLKFDEFEFLDYGGDFYKKSCRYGHIRIFYSGINHDMGIRVKMTGQGCREYEKHREDDFEWIDLFKEILAESNVNIPRFDLAIDDYSQQLNIKTMYRTAKRGCMVVPKVNVARYIEELELKTGNSKGQTLQVGKANWTVRFYDKKEERIAKGLEVTHESWNRYEIELHKELAKQTMQELLKPEITVGYIVKAFLKTKIDFKIKSATDKNRSRWKSQKYWVDFLDEVEKIEFVKKEADYNVQRSFRWVENSVTTTLAMLQEATQSPTVLNRFIRVVGKSKMDSKKEKAIDLFKNDMEARRQLNRYMFEVILDDRRRKLKEKNYMLVKTYDEEMKTKKHISAKDMLKVKNENVNVPV